MPVSVAPEISGFFHTKKEKYGTQKSTESDIQANR